MKKNFFYGFMVAVAVLMCSASFASPHSIDSGYTSPDYDTVALTADTADPVVAMAVGSDNDNGTLPCMATCRTSLDSDILANWRTDSLAMYANYKITDNRIPRTVLACGYNSEQIFLPQNVPRSV